MSVGVIRGRLDDVDWLNERLRVAGTWVGDRIASVRTTRIGEGYGLSGEIYRVLASTTSATDVSLVAKVEPIEKVERALAVQHHVAAHLGRSIPVVLGAETLDDVGVILFEDIHPAEQGDELRPTTQNRARDLTSVVARLHQIDVPDDGGVERWAPRSVEPDRWRQSIAGARRRYAERLDSTSWTRFERLGEEADRAARTLVDLPTSWLHGDPHLDNVLWRQDGTTVLLDWSNAKVGPAVLDVAGLLISLSFAVEPSLDPEHVIVLAAGSESVADEQFRAGVRSALLVRLRGVLGWTGLPDSLGDHPRKIELRDDAITRAHRAIVWVDEFG